MSRGLREKESARRRAIPRSSRFVAPGGTEKGGLMGKRGLVGNQSKANSKVSLAIFPESPRGSQKLLSSASPRVCRLARDAFGARVARVFIVIRQCTKLLRTPALLDVRIQYSVISERGSSSCHCGLLTLLGLLLSHPVTTRKAARLLRKERSPLLHLLLLLLRHEPNQHAPH